MQMQLDILSIGDELIIGQVVNTNASFIAKEFDRIGIATRRIVTVGDQKAIIQAELKASLEQVDIAVLTGGLGPTHDDITKAALAELFGLEYEFNEEAYQNCLSLFQRRGLKMPDINRSQAEVLRGALVLQNSCGTAPGMILHHLPSYPERYVVVMPGVPIEMQEMMRRSVLPYFAPLSKTYIKHTHLMTSGIGESQISELLGDEKAFLLPQTTLAYLPQTTHVKLRITTRGTDREQVEQENSAVVDFITRRLRKYLYATDDQPIEAVVGKLLQARRLTLATAESCTGGLIAHRITNVPGSSSYFLQSFVTYNNAAKERSLGVRHETLAEFGAVSEEVAREMAIGCLAKSGADIAIATTGIAGPSGGSDAKPVGMLCLGLATNHKLGNQVKTKTLYFTKDRLQNKELFSQAALDWLRLTLTETD
ncbi:MAG: competence/damage-inducible protein A [Chloroherpetonaceae bacterium]|nr:competence/damage-inducible protein A [Chloroherpetonaceae bacterium]MCS7211363.1 competence/damage-inducible protein A [Chloroherpetonaceae bacterium]MDW8018686.1 competence/damage-inducible protein A [Chloroherpetonaceae bacterium]